MAGQTTVSIKGHQFLLNGYPINNGQSFRGMDIGGLLLNARLVQGIFDDLNPETRSLWDGPDGPWDAEANTDRFVRAIDLWAGCGLGAFTINLQGGSPQGYSKDQPWHNSAFREDGSLRDAYLGRLARILDRADERGMVVILGLFYFAQDQRLADEEAVVRAVDNVVDWLAGRCEKHVLIEIANEIDHPTYTHDILSLARAPELVRHVQKVSAGRFHTPAGRLLVSTSQCGQQLPTNELLDAVDFVLLHGNGVPGPDAIRTMVDDVRAMKTYRDQPILFNEDDHFDFQAEENHFIAAVSRYAGWGYFDYRMAGEGHEQGYQSVPADWGMTSDRKKGFFRLLAEMTGATPPS